MSGFISTKERLQRGREQDQRRAPAERRCSSLSAGDEADPGQPDRHAGPAAPADLLAEQQRGQERGEDRRGVDEEARRSGAHRQLAHVQCDVVGRDPERAAREYARQVGEARAHASDDRPDQEQDAGRDGEAQGGQPGGREPLQRRADAGEGGGPQHDRRQDRQRRTGDMDWAKILRAHGHIRE
jgi:hypothetical protein